MPLRPPPPNLHGFPIRATAGSLTTLFRLTRRRDGTGALVRSPWWFSSTDATEPGRFDLPSPRGTCYWSNHRSGAWVEVFRGARQISEEDLVRLTMWTGRPPRLRFANLRVKRAYGFGVTAEISTAPDYSLPQRWASALANAGFDGLVGTCRHDPSSQALNIAVFGPAGTLRRRTGWSVAPTRASEDRELLAELATLGVRVVPAPFDVPITSPAV